MNDDASSFLCRGDRIRTCDLLVPNQERYRTALHPETHTPCLSRAKILLKFSTTSVSSTFYEAQLGKNLLQNLHAAFHLLLGMGSH